MNVDTICSEASIQETVIAYCDLNNIPVYHIPNEGKRSNISGARLKKIGLRKGVPDLCIPVPKGKYHGLYIELKSNKGKATQEQIEWLKLLKSNGYATAITYGVDEAITVIKQYISIKEEHYE
jgi:hypothetical protein